MAKVTEAEVLEVEPSMFVDAKIRAPWVLIARRRNQNTGVRVLSHHDTWAEASAAQAQLEGGS